MVAPPMIGMSRNQGPWPKCLGLSGEGCRDYIEENADNLRVEIIPPQTKLRANFDPERVRVFVDGDGIVDKIPKRG